MTVIATDASIAYHQRVLTWEGLSEADAEGSAVSRPGGNDRSVHVIGTFGGGTVTIQGSNEPTPSTWSTLHDAAGNNLTFTSAGLELVAENTRWLRPVLSGASGADIDVYLLIGTPR